MSTQRNNTPQSSRGRNVAAVIAAIVAPIAATIAACSNDPVTSPRSVTPAASRSATVSVKLPKPSAKDDANHETEAQLVVEAPTWHTTPDDKESGTDRPLNLACGISGVYSVAQPIGPNGGVLRFGASSLTIPKGALATTVMIGAKITLGQSVQVDFAPHGLQFAKAVTMTMNYTGCSIPSNGAVNVYYTNAFGGIEQSMPSANDASHNVVTSLTDHFSGYVVAWGRSSSTY